MIFLADYSYSHPFLQPLPVWDQWYLLMLPLCIAVSVVYKAIKCQSMKKVPMQAAIITAWILHELLRRRRRVGRALVHVVERLRWLYRIREGFKFRRGIS